MRKRAAPLPVLARVKKTCAELLKLKSSLFADTGVGAAPVPTDAWGGAVFRKRRRQKTNNVSADERARKLSRKSRARRAQFKARPVQGGGRRRGEISRRRSTHWDAFQDSGRRSHAAARTRREVLRFENRRASFFF